MNIMGTTILAVMRDGFLAIGGDGQVTLGDQVLKAKAKKVRAFYNGTILGGFAGHTADAFTLFERFEVKLEKASGNLVKASVELAKDWRTDRSLRRLEAMLLVGNKQQLLLLSGQGDVLEPDENVASIGSGGPMALASAKSLLRHTDYGAKKIVEIALGITAEQCIYTNENISVETLAP